MRAIILNEPGRLSLGEAAPVREPAAGEALVRVRRVGVCGTDLHAFAGDQPFFEYPRILGHELGVEVLAVGPGVEQSVVKPGDRCAVEPYLNCGRCIACRRGKSNCCATLAVLGVHVDGGMQPRIVVPAAKLHPSPTLSLEQLALVETLCIGAHAVRRALIQPGEWAAVIGVGPIGLGAAQFAIAAGARVIAVDMNATRLAFCQSQLGVSHVINARAEDVLARLTEITDGDLPTAVFDATGHAGSMTRAFEYGAPGGQLVLVGLTRDRITFADPHLHRREITVKASRNATPEDFQHVIARIETGAVDTSPWVTHRAAFRETCDVFASWTDPATGVVKAMIDVDGED